MPKPSTDNIITSAELYFRDPRLEPPPTSAKLICLSKYGICTVTDFIPGFHIAWQYCPKIPSSVRDLMA